MFYKSFKEIGSDWVNGVGGRIRGREGSTKRIFKEGKKNENEKVLEGLHNLLQSLSIKYVFKKENYKN